MKNQIAQLKTIGLLIVTLMVTPGFSHAGWFSSKVEATKTKVQTRVSTAATKTKETASNIKDKVEDISNKLNDIYSQIESNRPLMNKVKNSPMMGNLKEILKFMQDAQEDYQNFANSGADTFRRDMQDILYDFGNIISAFPAIERGDKMINKLDKVSDMMDKIPGQFLYVMHKAVGDKLADLRVKVGDLSNQLARLPKLPKSRELYRDPQAYEVELCQLVDSRGAAVTVAVIQAKLKEIIWGLKTIASYMPDDLTFSVTAVAGGGFTATKHPAKVPFKVPLTVLEAVELKISNDVSIANAMCKGVLPK